MVEGQNVMNKAGPSSCALGPNAIATLDAQHLCETHESFSSATIYFPKESEKSQLLPSIVLVGGWGCGERAMAAWAPFFASHGIVAMTIGTPAPWKDTPEARCQALLDASQALQSEHTRSDSPLHQRLDLNARAVMGYSLGGGGAQLAALKDPTLKCSVAICPHDGREHGTQFPPELSASVPVLFVCSERDKEADPQKQAWAQYKKTSAPKLIFEISGGDHYSATGPAGGTKSEFEQGGEPYVLCNCLLAMVCGIAPCPFGTYNGPTGFAKKEAPRGAIGGVVLAWLQLFLLDDESARSRLAARPDVASGFESQNMVRN
jgi:dienelactone hydrolase